MLKFLAHEYDDVSAAVIELAKEYIQILKQMPVRHELQQEHIKVAKF